MDSFGASGGDMDILATERQRMKTLFEEIMKLDCTTDQDKLIQSEMDKSEIINIQNVADYYFANTQEMWDIRTDFPNVAPPFSEFWMEYVMPDKIYNGTRFIPNPMPGGKLGWLVVSKEAQEENKHNIKWWTLITLFSKVKGVVQRREFQWVLAIDKYGKVVQFTFHPSERAEKLPQVRFGIEKHGGDFGLTMLNPCLLAISFLHCKNVQYVPHSPSSAIKRRARNQTRVKYHTLQIEPMKKVLRTEGKSEETGLKHALHICRGHFKDFTKGKGLFGKYKEIFWWDSQVRGSGERGVVLKDYKVNEPEVVI